MRNYLQKILKKSYTRDNLFYPVLEYLVERYSYVIYRLKFRDDFKLLSKTKKLQGIMKKRNAFVFANGPSLDKLNYEKVKLYQQKGFQVICLNSFISSFKRHGIIPNFYVLSDPAYFGHDNISESLKTRVLQDIHLIEKYKIPLFAPLQFSKKVDINVEVYFFNDGELLWKNKNVKNILKPRSYLSMTAYKALAIAEFLGFEKTYIAGFDNDYVQSTHVGVDNEIYFDDRHFDSKGKKKLRQYDNKIVQNMADLVFSFSFLFSDLYKFDKNIINLDPDSLVDAFCKRHMLDIYDENY